MKDFIKRILVIVVFIAIAILIINNAPQYELDYKYKNGDLRVIVNDVEITRNISKLPEVAALHNGNVLLSSNTIDILFDKDLFYDQKNDTFITISDTNRADITIGSNTVVKNGIDTAISTPAIKVNYDYSTDDRYEQSKENKDVYYIPIKDLEDIYDIDVEFNDKLIITSKDINLSSFVVNEDRIDVKYLDDKTSKTIDTAKSGDTIYLFDYNVEKDFNKVRTQNGEIGYLSKDIIDGHSIQEVYTKKEQVNEQENISLAWDYINPIAGSVENKINRTKVANLDVLAPTVLYFQDSTGEIYYKKALVSDYVNWAKKQGYKVWATLKNEKIGDKDFTIDDLSLFLNDMNHRKKAINQVISFCRSYKIDGINVDIENIYLEDATAFSQFIRELSVETKNNNLVLSVCVNIPDGSDTWSKCYQHYSLAEAADYLAVMTYDVSKSQISSFAPYDWVEENLQKLIERDHVPANKLIMGIPFGSAYWQVTDGVAKRSIYLMNSAKKYLKNATWDDSAKQYHYVDDIKGESIWIEESRSIKEKIELSKKYGLSGVAFWQLGQETSDVWQAFDS
ncbi:MAG: hypothetical protein IKI57_06505 [Clostridia bacterium]|nr:hypothetical protein [Clostridia bacterium]